MKNHYYLLIKNNIKYIFTIKMILCIIIIFIINLIMKTNNNIDYESVYEYISITFYGPINMFDNLNELLSWSFYEICFLAFIIRFLNKEFSNRSIYLISRLGNKIRWYNYLQLTILVLTIIYFMIGFLTSSLFTIIINENIINIDIFNILKLLLLIIMYNYFIILLYIIIFLFIENRNLGIIALIMLIYLSIELGNSFHIDKFLLLNQGIISKHIISDFSFLWSYIYLGVFIGYLFIFIKNIVIKRDLISIID